MPLPNVCFMLPFRLKDQYTLIEQLAYLVFLKLAFTNTTQLAHNQSIAIALHDVYNYAVEVYNVCDVTVKWLAILQLNFEQLLIGMKERIARKKNR